MKYPLKWNIEKGDKNYLKPYTTMASSKQENGELKVCGISYTI